MSPDGQTIYGNLVGWAPERSDFAYGNFRWTQETGTQYVRLQPLTPQSPTKLNGFTPDQRWLFGMSGQFPSQIYESHACMWRSDGSAIDLDAYFDAQGQFPMWDLVSVNFMSSDQRTIIGVGGLDRPVGFNWIATLPDSFPCDSVDFNNDASLFDPRDVEAFLSVYSEGPCIPSTATCNDIDFNNDTSVFDPCDISSFLLMYSEGPCTPCGQ